jgi:hypothetical protein
VLSEDLFGPAAERRREDRRLGDKQSGDRRKGAGWRMSPRLLVFEVLAFLVFAVLAGAGFLAWRLSQGPINLEFFRPGIERSLTEARGGQPTRIGTLVLEWSRDRARVEVAAKDVTALDSAGHVVSRAEKAVITFDTAALLSGKLKTRRLRVENGHAAVVRAKGGVWTVANVEVLREPEKKDDKPFDPFNDFKWVTLAQPIRALVTAGSFEQVDLVNFNLDVVDEETGKTWSANPVNGVWLAGKDGVALNLDIGLAGNAKPNRIQIALNSDAAVTRATAKLSLDGVDLDTLAGMFGVPQDVFKASKPASASFEISATERAGLDNAKLSIGGASGKAVIGPVDFDIADLAFQAAFDPATKRIDMTKLKIVSDRVTGEFAGSIDVSRYFNGHIGQGSPFTLTGKDMTLLVTPMFEGPWPIAQVNIVGELASDGPRIRITQISGATGAANVQGVGEVWLGDGDLAGKVGVKFDGKATGAVTPQQILAFWPVKAGPDARNWAKEHVLAGTATNVTAHIDWPPGANDKGWLENEVVKVDFDIANATVMYLRDFPAVTAGFGKGHLEGNQISFDIAGGKVGTWKLDEGKVTIPAFHPAGAIMQITGSGTGELRDLMRVLDASNLKTAQKYGINIEGMSGGGFMNLDLRIPMLGDATPEDAIKYSVHGGFRRATAPDLAMGFGLTESDATVDLTEAGLRIKGAGRFGPAQTSFDWYETFNKDKTTHSDLTAKALVTPDLLNAFGFAARTMMQGEADMQLKASGQGRDFTSITAEVDFAKSALDIPELGWKKKYDVPAKGVFRYGGDKSKGVITGDINADGLQLSGDVELNGAGDMQRGTIERIFARDSVDLHGDLSRKNDGGLAVSLSGPFFDASPWMDGWLNMDRPAPPPGQPASTPGPPAAAPNPPISLKLNADKIRVRENADLLNARVALELGDEGPRSGTITGLAAPGKKVEVKIETDGAAHLYSGKSDDAGFAARVMLKADYLIGGQMTFTSRFDGAKGKAQVTATDVRLRDAPLLAQILSLASLRGLTDVLNGDGVLFTHADIPLNFDHGRIDLPGLRASGPAMGLTARGWVQPAQGNISLDGVLVPSFGINSVLGGIPIIGDLFVSRQGEGVFSPTYQVRGTLERAQISINPVSAITPGVVRRIFENPAEPPPPDAAKPVAPATAAPPDAQSNVAPKPPPKAKNSLTSKTAPPPGPAPPR